ncbi:hypothetical protein RIF29_32167 [Crotalaria pallida]|uniref:Uncharacterized protein n=1 Tax=Crotalaria pallida TaxID=3830 RepID=A0AAN9HXJ8_CROPI
MANETTKTHSMDPNPFSRPMDPNKVDLRSGELYNEEPNPSLMVVVFFSWRQHGCETEIGILDHGVQADGVMVFNLGCGALLMPMRVNDDEVAHVSEVMSCIQLPSS